MDDLLSEKWLSFRAAARILGDAHHHSVRRWATTGLKGVVLESFLIGGRRFTTRQAIRRFVARMNALDQGKLVPAKSPRRKERQIEWSERRQRQIAAAEAELNRLGIRSQRDAMGNNGDD